jgi:hypothetical protein
MSSNDLAAAAAASRPLIPRDLPQDTLDQFVARLATIPATIPGSLLMTVESAIARFERVQSEITELRLAPQ